MSNINDKMKDNDGKGNDGKGNDKGKGKDKGNGLFIFRRDFRVIDNNALNVLYKKCSKIYPIFIFTPEQITSKNKYRSNNSVQFMIESLIDLDQQIRKTSSNSHLMVFYGNNMQVLKDLIQQLDISVVGFNIDYSPYAIARDADIFDYCKKQNISIEYGHDYYLHVPGTILNGSGDAYQKFTPFYHASMSKHVDSPENKKQIHFISSSNKDRKSVV